MSKLNLDAYGNDEYYSRSGWGYSYILSWISDATRMTPEEFANWQCIKANLKKRFAVYKQVFKDTRK